VLRYETTRWIHTGRTYEEVVTSMRIYAVTNSPIATNKEYRDMVAKQALKNNISAPSSIIDTTNDERFLLSLTNMGIVRSL
jgi:hypothetical protein